MCVSPSPGGLRLCRSGTLAWMRLPLWTSCSRRSLRLPASAGAVTVLRDAARRRSTGMCRSPTWTDPPRLLFCRTTAGAVDAGQVAMRSVIIFKSQHSELDNSMKGN